VTDNLRGAAFMALAMAGFAVEDLFLKQAARHMPPGQVILIVGLAGVAVFAAMARARGEPVLPRAFLAPPLLIRSGFEMVGRVFYSLAVALTPLSTTSAILQATPLVVVASAALLFGERVGWRRWTAILAGFAGVLIVLRPGLKGFSALSLLAVMGMIGFAGRDLATRAAPKVLSNRQLGVAGFAVFAASGALVQGVHGDWAVPGPAGLGLVALTSAFAIAAYHALTFAMRTGEVSFVTPFRYTRLVFAMILAASVLGERPDAMTLAGSAVIVTSGLYILIRGGR
jgi:drug/metabolite transporter (DMT)-like permease